jgi:hypothetical protein
VKFAEKGSISLSFQKATEGARVFRILLEITFRKPFVAQSVLLVVFRG